MQLISFLIVLSILQVDLIYKFWLILRDDALTLLIVSFLFIFAQGLKSKILPLSGFSDDRQGIFR
jgi:hypothetical protein